MSTKIYDGMRLAPGAPDVLDMPRALAPVINDVRRRLEIQVCHIKLCSLAREGLLADDFSLGMMMFELDREIDKARQSMTRDPWFGIEFSITFMRSGDRVLALPFAQRCDYLHAIKTTGFFEEYGYWDNADEPEGMTREGWEERRIAWENAYGPTWTAIEYGLTYENVGAGAIVLSCRDWTTQMLDEVIRNDIHKNKPLDATAQRSYDLLADMIEKVKR